MIGDDLCTCALFLMFDDLIKIDDIKEVWMESRDCFCERGLTAGAVSNEEKVHEAYQSFLGGVMVKRPVSSWRVGRVALVSSVQALKSSKKASAKGPVTSWGTKFELGIDSPDGSVHLPELLTHVGVISTAVTLPS